MSRVGPPVFRRRAHGWSRTPGLVSGMLLLAALACDNESVRLVQEVPAPAAEGSAEPNVAAGPDGFYLTWLVPSGPDTHALRFARWDGNGWSEARTIVDRADLFVNWADFPSLAALGDGALAVHWLQKSGPGTFAYDVRMALSEDGGQTWSESFRPHTDTVQAEHGFVSLLPLDGNVGVVWLDGRETVAGQPMTLRFASVGLDGSLDQEALLDPSTCDCCQTAMALAGDVPVAVYRGRTEDEVRDIRVVRRQGQWTTPAVVHDDGWVINACPVNGPAIDADGPRVAVAWFTAAAQARGAGEAAAEGDPSVDSRVLLAFSDDYGATFSQPVRVDGGYPLGRVDLELLDNGSALVLWLERTAGGADVRLQAFDSRGPRGNAATLGATSSERVSGFPRMAARGNRLLLAYTEPPTDSTGSRIRTVSVVMASEESAP